MTVQCFIELNQTKANEFGRDWADGGG
jgi:hypothetical protein